MRGDFLVEKLENKKLEGKQKRKKVAKTKGAPPPIARVRGSRLKSNFWLRPQKVQGEMGGGGGGWTHDPLSICGTRGNVGDEHRGKRPDTRGKRGKGELRLRLAAETSNAIVEIERAIVLGIKQFLARTQEKKKAREGVAKKEKIGPTDRV